MRTFAVAAAIVVLGASSQAQFLGTFDSNNQNWRFVTLSSPFLSTPSVSSGPSAAPWLSTYGNPPGSIGWTSDPGGYQYWATPASWAGNRLDWYGGSLTWQYWYWTSTGSWTNTWGDVAIRTTGGTWLVADVTAVAPTMAPSSTNNTVWNNLSVTFTPGVWRLNNMSGSFATAAQLQAALSNLDYIVIRGEVREGTTEAMRLDNVRLTPIPEAGTLASLGSFFTMGLAWMWRRRQMRA